MSVIVSTALPEEAETGIGNVDGVWVTNNLLAVKLAGLLRDTLIKVAYQKTVNVDQGRKADVVYKFITSRQFVSQIEAIVEAYSEMHMQITKEKAAYERLWKVREAQLERILMSTANVYGSMQGMVGGTTLPSLKGLELPLLDASGIDESDD